MALPEETNWRIVPLLITGCPSAVECRAEGWIVVVGREVGGSANIKLKMTGLKLTSDREGQSDSSFPDHLYWSFTFFKDTASEGGAGIISGLIYLYCQWQDHIIFFPYYLKMFFLLLISHLFPSCLPPSTKKKEKKNKEKKKYCINDWPHQMPLTLFQNAQVTLNTGGQLLLAGEGVKRNLLSKTHGIKS